jgi:hypothetical protein
MYLKAFGIHESNTAAYAESEPPRGHEELP